MDRLRLLELGADDYLVKPVDLEGSPRARAITRRAQQAQPRRRQRAQPRRTQAAAGAPRGGVEGTLVPLTNREFWLLETLVRKKGQIVSRERLEEALYGWETRSTTTRWRCTSTICGASSAWG